MNVLPEQIGVGFNELLNAGLGFKIKLTSCVFKLIHPLYINEKRYFIWSGSPVELISVSLMSEYPVLVWFCKPGILSRTQENAVPGKLLIGA